MKSYPFKFAVVAFALAAASSAFAQEGCQQVQASCSQMKARCEQSCQNAQNPSRCMGAVCEANLANCKQTGVWKAAGNAAACWKTSSKN